MERFDVVVVGAGPGGSYAAKTAAELGLKTVFFERGSSPGIKNSSGCGLGARWWRDFPEIMAKIPEAPSYRKADMIIIKVVDEQNRLRLVYGTTGSDRDASVWTGGDLDKGMAGAGIYRKDLDPMIADMAVAAGAQLRTSTLVTEALMENGLVRGVKTEKGETIRAEVVIAADGAMSTMARTSGLRNRWGGGCTLVPQMDFGADPEKLDLAVGSSEWCWFGPFNGAYQVNFHDGFHLGAGQWLRSDWKTKPVDIIKKVMAIPEFQNFCKLVDAKPREFQSHMLPWLKEPVKSYTGGMMLVGDAAGFPCPLDAEGVWHACLSGRIAAQTAGWAIGRGDVSEQALAEYERRWKASPLGLEHAFGKEVVDLWDHSIFDPELMKGLIQLLLEYSELHPFGILFDWSDAHMENLNKHINHLLDMMPEYAEFTDRYLKPLGRAINQQTRERILLRIKSNLPVFKYVPDQAFLSVVRGAKSSASWVAGKVRGGNGKWTRSSSI
ncbi:MAG TPA: NAD(P)/FAD-dependent oxidoreductase [Deltaproteobacteria bacterium]|nr:NAD(P)/FAD-dependent oxidoreductase [Deltaproteobacteria bacterium]